MITFKYRKSQLKSIQRGLYALKAGDIPFRGHGICASLSEKTYVNIDDFLHHCFATWKHFSGNYSYPVPSPYSDESSASDVYETTHEYDMWNPEHPYGSLRLDLLEHLIRECKDAIDNGGYNDE